MRSQFFDTDRKFSWGFAIILIVVFILFVCSQMHAEQKFMVPGRDPQDKDVLPIVGQHIVISDDPICSDGWGSGSGKRTKGCYPPGTAAIVWDVDSSLFAILRCGNTPQERIVVKGKVIPTSATTPATATANANANANATAATTDRRQEVPADNYSGGVVGGTVIPPASVYRYDACGHIIATCGLGICVEVVEVPFCQLAPVVVVQGGYYPRGYEHRGYEHHGYENRGGGGRPQPPSRPIQQPVRPVRPVRPNPTPTPPTTGTANTGGSSNRGSTNTGRAAVRGATTTGRSSAIRSAAGSASRGYSGGGRSGGGHR